MTKQSPINFDQSFEDEPLPMTVDIDALERAALRHQTRRGRWSIAGIVAAVFVVVGTIVVTTSDRNITPSTALSHRFTPVGNSGALTTPTSPVQSPTGAPQYRHLARFEVASLLFGTTPEFEVCLYAATNEGALIGITFDNAKAYVTDPARALDDTGKEIAHAGEAFVMAGGIDDATQVCDGDEMAVFRGHREL